MYRHSIFQAIFCCRIIALVRYYFVTDSLNRCILRGFDGKPATVDQIVCLCFGIPLFIHEILNYIFDQCIRKIGVRCCVRRDGCSFEDPVVYLVCHGLVIFCLGNVPLVQHIAENGFTACGILFRICHRIIVGWILRDGCNDRTFGKCKVSGIFVEVTGCSCLYAETSLTEVDRVHIGFKDLFLAHFFFNLKGEILFLQLSLNFVEKRFLIDKVREYIVFDKLLGQCTGTFGKIETVGDAYDTGSYDTLEINPIVFVKTFVLDRHECMGKILGICRDLLICFIDTVGIGIFQSLDHVSALISNISRISLGKYVICRDCGSIVYDLLGKDRASYETYDSQKEYTYDKSFKEPYAYSFLFHSLFRRNTFFSSGKVSISVIHE